MRNKKKSVSTGKEAYDFKLEEKGLEINKHDQNLGSEIDQMLEESIEDIDNGVWEGWLMMSDITERDYHSKMFFNFVSINQNTIEFRPQKHKEPHMKFKTFKLNYLCINNPNSCSAVEYLQY